MERKAQLEFCKQCTNRKSSLDKGIICSLTGEQAAFERTCSDFKEDEKQAELIIRELEEREKELNSNAIGMQKGILTGVLTIVLAVVWFLVGIFALNRVFFYPAILLVIGVISIVKGIKNQNEEKRKRSNEDILDNDI